MTSPVAEALLLLALAAHAGDTPPAPWVYVGLPQQQLPATRYSVASIEGRRALRVEAERSYGNLLHPLVGTLAGTRAGTLQWTWRVDQPLTAANLRSKAGDDAALKVCAMFDLPRERVPFVERQLLRLAEARLGEPIPSATLCYVWDPSLPRDTLLDNAYSRRLRFITLGGEPGRWHSETRNLASDFLRAFGDESSSVPPLRALALGADADNTGGHSIGWVESLRLLPPGP